MSSRGPSGRGVNSASQAPQRNRGPPWCSSRSRRRSAVFPTPASPATSTSRPCELPTTSAEPLIERRELARPLEQLAAFSRRNPCCVHAFTFAAFILPPSHPKIQLQKRAASAAPSHARTAATTRRAYHALASTCAQQRNTCPAGATSVCDWFSWRCCWLRCCSAPGPPHPATTFGLLERIGGEGEGCSRDPPRCGGATAAGLVHHAYGTGQAPSGGPAGVERRLGPAATDR